MSKRKIGIYLGRFQPFHKGHIETKRIAEEQYGLDVVFVLFTYTPHKPSYNFLFSFEEQEELAKALGLKIERFEIDISKKYWRNLLPWNFVKKWLELRRVGGRGKKRYITRDWQELLIMAFLLLHPLYIPFRNDEEKIRSSHIRELIYKGKIEEAYEYLPSDTEYRSKLLEILKKKDIERIKSRVGYELVGFKIPPRPR